MPDAIPLIDLREPEEACIRALGRACREVGFFGVVGHDVAPDLLDETFAAARRFFAGPERLKRAVGIERSPHNRGYVGIEAESLDPAQAPDRKEAFNIGLELPADDPEMLAGAPFRGPNLWPDLPGFRATGLAYFNAVWDLGLGLHRLIARDLGLPPGFFADKFDRPLATLRYLRYPAPAGAPKPGQIGAGAHTDYGSLTILATDGTPGLQVRGKDGAWLDVPRLPGAFVGNIGDCLMRWTNDLYLSTPHRVLQPERERLSIAFFLDPNPDAVIAALPGCVSAERPARYPPITGGAYLKERLDATYGHRQALPTS